MPLEGAVKVSGLTPEATKVPQEDPEYTVTHALVEVTSKVYEEPETTEETSLYSLRN